MPGCNKYWMKNDVDLGSGGCLLELEGKLVVAVMPEFYAKNSLLFGWNGKILALWAEI